MTDIHLDLKPLSANLKRINIGKVLILEEFNHILEENLLDELWLACQQEWLKYNRPKIIGADYDRYTNSYIIALNHAYYFHLKKEGDFPQQTFNNLILLGFEFFMENDKDNTDLSKLFEILKSLEIINNETINKLTSIIKTDNSIPNKKISNENMIKKYQIFISSTFIDLKEERQAAVEAILMKGHIPAGMELFSANDKSQWEVIKKWIDDSDIYILILGGRYGSIDSSTGKSYTQMEYEYASSKGKPLFSLVLQDNIIDNKPREITKDYDLKDERYKSFKNTITSNMCSFPENIDQIKLKIHHSLDNLISEHKDQLSGWIKG
ncbi:DUF4062 domain-containing protein [Flavobacterium rakeshii]|uniref:DUF4062 domain-containing protein n=1 Tax=Flavobacterium rakeshii TaxID=1038845 RepID=UPI002E7B1C1D|nr:DUF4062 domain-containing protein [Flavobacterium rakeshii]MEE1898130.1 DUF4062 domain-containing protein [Flavobacterium rakeshii]